MNCNNISDEDLKIQNAKKIKLPFWARIKEKKSKEDEKYFMETLLVDEILEVEDNG